MSPDDVARSAEEGARRFLATMERLEDVRLGLDREALRWLDGLIEARRERWHHDLDPSSLENLKRLFASFVGECLVHRLGGTWSWMSQPVVRLRSEDGEIHLVFPFAPVDRTMAGEPGASLFHFFTLMEAMTGHAPATVVDDDGEA